MNIQSQYRKKGKIPVQKIESENIEETIAEEIWNGILTSFNAFRQDQNFKNNKKSYYNKIFLSQYKKYS